MSINMLPALVGLPFAAALAITFRLRPGPVFWSLGAALPALAGTVLLLPAAIEGGSDAAFHVVRFLPGLSLSFHADPLGLTFALLAAGLWIATTVYSSGYVRAEELSHTTRYYACFAASVGSALGVALAANLLTFLIFYELLTFSTYPLVMHKETPEARAAGRRYLAFALGGGVALTIAVAWVWTRMRTLDFVPGGFLDATLGGSWLLAALFFVGCGVKAAVMPLHAWLPAAMVAPTPVSALLHAVAVVKAGVFGFLRVIGFVFGPAALAGSPSRALAVACAVTIVAGSLMALRQDNLKRRLAYSTVVHLSLIVLGAILLAPTAMTGAILHFVNHGITKITMFFCAGAIHAATGISSVSRLEGVGRRMPWTAAAMTVAAFSLVGFPGLCGFVSKLLLCHGAIGADQLAFAFVILTGSILSAAYLFPIIRALYAPGESAVTVEPGVGPRMVAPLVATAALTLLFGLLPGVIDAQYRLAQQVTLPVFGGVR